MITPLSTSPSSAVKQKDTDTTSGLGSPKAANCRKLREYNVESIPLAWPLPCIPAEQLPPVPARGWIPAELDCGSEPGGAPMPLCRHVPCCIVHSWWVLLIPRTQLVSLPALCPYLGGMRCWCTPKGESGYPPSGLGSSLVPEVTF